MAKKSKFINVGGVLVNANKTPRQVVKQLNKQLKTMVGDVRGKVLGEGTISSDTFERAFENHEAIAEGNDYGIEFDFEGPNGFYLTDKGRKNADTSLAAMASITG